MSKNKQRNNEDYTLLPQNCIDALPYLRNIRASWIANKSHCNPQSPIGSKRDHYVEKGISMCDEWSDEVGFLRYYIWHIDNGYKVGKTKLKRIDDNKGFSPDNCLIEKTPEKKAIKPQVINEVANSLTDIDPNDIKSFMKVASFIVGSISAESSNKNNTMIELISQYTKKISIKPATNQ